MAIPFLFILLFFALLGAVACFLNPAETRIARLFWYLCGVVLSGVIIAGFTWFFMANNMPYQIKSVTRHEIKTVIYPDGTTQQMFTVDGTHYNAHARWHKVIDEKEWEVECIEPVTEYRGLEYYGTGGEKYRAKFNLVRKEKK